MEDGVHYVYGFLDGWFIEKCLWSSRNSLKETVVSIKKFYQCMSEKEYVSKDDYNELCSFIKENMDEFLEQMDAFHGGGAGHLCPGGAVGGGHRPGHRRGHGAVPPSV